MIMKKNITKKNKEETETNVEHIISDLQKKIVNFCMILPLHVQTWKNVLEEMQDPVKALINFSEQLRLIERANIKCVDNFLHIQRELQIKILGHIEDEIGSIKLHIEKLNRTNNDLKNKLSLLERATINLDWDINSFVIKGSPTQPRLDKLLQMSYRFWIFFSDTFKEMNSKLIFLNIRDEMYIKDFQKLFTLKLDSIDKYSQIYSILALTQYVINEKSVI